MADPSLTSPLGREANSCAQLRHLQECSHSLGSGTGWELRQGDSHLSYHTLAPSPLLYLPDTPGSVIREAEIEAVLGCSSLSRNSRKTSNGCPGSKTLLTSFPQRELGIELATSYREDRKSAFTNHAWSQQVMKTVSPTGVGAVP